MNKLKASSTEKEPNNFSPCFGGNNLDGVWLAGKEQDTVYRVCNLRIRYPVDEAKIFLEHFCNQWHFKIGLDWSYSGIRIWTFNSSEDKGEFQHRLRSKCYLYIFLLIYLKRTGKSGDYSAYSYSRIGSIERSLDLLSLFELTVFLDYFSVVPRN